MVEPCIELHTVCAAGDVAGISDVGYMAGVLSARIMKWPLGTGDFFCLRSCCPAIEPSGQLARLGMGAYGFS